MEGETEAGNAQAPAQGLACPEQAGRTAMASGALARLRWAAGFTSKNKHVPQALPVPPGQSRLCARPAAPAAQAILISVWVHAGVANQSPRSSVPAPQPPPPVPGSAHFAGSRGQWSCLEFESWPLRHLIQEPSLSFLRYSQQSLQPATSVACHIGR